MNNHLSDQFVEYIENPILINDSYLSEKTLDNEDEEDYSFEQLQFENSNISFVDNKYFVIYNLYNTSSLSSSEVVIIDCQDIEDKDLNNSQEYFKDKAFATIEKVIEKDKNYLDEEGVELPTKEVQDTTRLIINSLAIYDIFPNDISTSIEGGLCLIFINKVKRLFLEIYNDGDYGYIIENIISHELLENQDLYSVNDTIERINKFYV